ncbi:hypothetical protein VPH35_026091 [Triticum aestivum]
MAINLLILPLDEVGRLYPARLEMAPTMRSGRRCWNRPAEVLRRHDGDATSVAGEDASVDGGAVTTWRRCWNRLVEVLHPLSGKLHPLSSVLGEVLEPLDGGVTSMAGRQAGGSTDEG